MRRQSSLESAGVQRRGSRLTTRVPPLGPARRPRAGGSAFQKPNRGSTQLFITRHKSWMTSLRLLKSTSRLRGDDDGEPSAG